mmetsp:Transcript_21010/g.30781  ORF Transcript_21010/g.30781 Transcript_21010/m.30781 type:complete len:96 (+) Transcript_21010:51-338(+)
MHWGVCRGRYGDYCGKLGGGGGNKIGPVPIIVRPSGKGIGTDSVAMTVVTSTRGENMGPLFISGDIVVLAYNNLVSKNYIFREAPTSIEEVLDKL